MRRKYLSALNTNILFTIVHKDGWRQYSVEKKQMFFFLFFTFTLQYFYNTSNFHFRFSFFFFFFFYLFHSSSSSVPAGKQTDWTNIGRTSVPPRTTTVWTTFFLFFIHILWSTIVSRVLYFIYCVCMLHVKCYLHSMVVAYVLLKSVPMPPSYKLRIIIGSSFILWNMTNISTLRNE